MSDTEEIMMMDEDSAGDDDFGMEASSDEENYAPQAKTVRGKATGKGGKAGSTGGESNASVLSTSNTNVQKSSNAGAGRGKKKTVEETYQKKSQLEHILLRPDTYIGSVEPHTQRMFVLDGDVIVEREITFTPGLFKIFDEIVVNAADNKQRDPNMDRIEITVDRETNVLSVKNNGKGIPIVLHKEHNVYVPELIFGHLLTGSNFDDDEKKTTGGRNGYGAKLANVFSTSFTVECVDTENGLQYNQTFSNNMTVIGKPSVRKCTAVQAKKGDFVKITFTPELSRFKMPSLDTDTVALLSKRAYDIAGTMANSIGKKLGVWLNGKKLSVGSFREYLGVFRDINKPVAYEKNDRWEIAVAASSDSTMVQVSFVNSISTSKGGGHVTYIADQLASHLQKTLKKKNKGGSDIKPTSIKNHLSIYVNCLVENPAFDSQTKDFLTTRAKNFGSDCKLSDAFLKKVEKSDIVETILSYATFKDKQALKRKGGVKKVKLTGIVKLDDANHAGTAKSIDCTLIITEGDSAKSLAVSGLSVVGRDYYGVFPLRGKPLNVRDASTHQVTSNEEIKNLVSILGLKYGEKYETEADIKKLRYGHLMIMSDQDVDGSHIKGLVINFIHNFWPNLLNRPGFLQQFITPIVKVSKGKNSKTFFNLPEYTNWLSATGDGKGWNIKYYKGLGTSTSAEAKEYFSNLDTHEVHFSRLEDDKVQRDEDDELTKALPDAVASGSDMIDMVFRKARVEDRKQWLNNTPMETFMDYSVATVDGVKYSDFINKEYILFSRYDNERSIPQLFDGFKPSQRKVLFACFKRRLKGEVKVAQLTGYIAEHSAYHHGEASLQGTIVGMAQTFVGSNNINLLTPSGQFGTRRMGGKDAASARYIFTKLEPITRLIFHPDDDDLLNYRSDDGQKIEPDFYCPVIPMVLVNGADGIGTGWSSSVNNYNPRNIVANIRRRLNGEDFEPMRPFYYGFSGDILHDEDKPGSFSANGVIERTSDTTLVISELPIRKWTQDYKIFLDKFLVGDAKKPPEIRDFRENHTDTTVSFTIICEKEKIDEFEKEKGGLLAKFKMTGCLNTSNMNLFNEEGRITKYKDPREILQAFYVYRLDFYDKRKALLVEKLHLEQRRLSNKARFVEEVCEGKLIVSNRKRKEILAELQDRGYEMFMPSKKDKNDSESEDEEEAESNTSDGDLAKGYEYLLGMKIWSLTFEKAQKLRAELAEKTKALEELEATAPAQIWLNDLDAIEAALVERDQAFAFEEAQEVKAQKKNQTRRDNAAATKTKAKRGKKKPNEWDSDLELSDEEGAMDVDDSDDEVKPKRKVAARKPAAAKAASRKPAQPTKQKLVQATLDVASNHASAEKDDEEEIALVNTMEASLHVSPPPKKVSDTKKRPPSPVLDDSGSDSEGVSAQQKTSKAAPVVKKTGRGKNAAPAKKAPAKKPAKKTVIVLDSDSEDSDDFEFHSDGEEAPVKVAASKPAARARSARARKPIVYQLDDSDDEL